MDIWVLLLTFIISAIIYSCYSELSIKHKTNTLLWHLAQWLSAWAFMLSGYLICVYFLEGFTWYDFGEVAAIGALAVFTYVLFLHRVWRKII